jgi:hypothetical protein
MTSLSQFPRDRILWTPANNGGKMERSRLRAATGIRYIFAEVLPGVPIRTRMYPTKDRWKTKV